MVPAIHRGCPGRQAPAALDGGIGPAVSASRPPVPSAPDEATRPGGHTGGNPSHGWNAAKPRACATIVMRTLDRICCNLREVLNHIHELAGRGIGVRS
jgi:hypothetical protein